jgi:hypothetical protein
MKLNIFLLSAAAMVDAATASDHGVDLGTAANFVILSKAGISTVPTSAITGNIAVSPIAAGAITGFGLTLDSSNQFSTASQVAGNVYAANYAEPTPPMLTSAVLDMQAAYGDAAERAMTGDGQDNQNPDIGTVTLTAGVYNFDTDIHISSELTFDAGGDSDAVFIIQTSGSLKQDYGALITLIGDAKPENIYWQVAQTVEVGVGATMKGIILAAEKVDFLTGSTLEGRIFSQTAVTLQSATITEMN